MTKPTRLAMLRMALLITLAFRSTSGEALGLGPLRLQSALGQPLRASVQILGTDTKGLNETCLRSRLTSSDGAEILRPDIELRRSKTGGMEIAIASQAAVEEPAVSLLVEITCAPGMHRDYQLLLDLSNGLPGVQAASSGSPRSVSTRVAAVSEALVGADTGAGEARSSRTREQREQRKKRNRRAPLLADANVRGAADLAMAPEPDAAAIPVRTKTAATARNVLKLTPAESLGMGKPLKGLKFSNSLAEPAAEASPAESEDIAAAKARFLAMLHDEDALLMARKQVRTLQAQLEKPAVAPVAAAEPASVAMPSMFRNMPDFNKWLIALALLLMASVALIPLLIRSTRRKGDKSSTPWWLATNDAGSREEALLESARALAAGKKAGAVESASVSEDPTVGEDKALQRYVRHFMTRKAGAPDPLETRIEPAVDAPPAAGAASVAAARLVRDQVESHHHQDDGPDGLEIDHRNRAIATFELVSDVMQEAEFWKMLNETQRAIDILENYCSDEASSSPVPWLYLADLYLGNGDVDRHAQLRELFRSRFNGRIPDDQDTDADPRHSLEDYPHLMQQISELWGAHDVVPFLQDLLMNRRDTPRQGFNLPVYREILLLIDVAREREHVEA